MRTVHPHGTSLLRVLTLACALALLGAVAAVPAPATVVAQDDAVVPPGCRVLETYPPQVVCDPVPGDPGPGNIGSDDPVCSAPAGEIDCGPVPDPGGTDCPGQTEPNGGCSVPGDPGPGSGSDGCDPTADPTCGVIIDAPPPIVVDPGDGGGDAPPCPAAWATADGYCEIPIGTLPGDGDGDDGSCELTVEQVCPGPLPEPDNDGVVGVDPCALEAAADVPACDLPISSDPNPDDTIVCSDDCWVPAPPPITGGPDPDDDPSADNPIPVPEAGPWVSVRRLAAPLGRDSLESAPVVGVVLTWLQALLR